MTRFSARLLLPICLLAGCAPPDTRSSRSQTMLDTAETQSALFDTCAWMGWYGDGECDEYCLEPDPDCGPPPLGPKPSGSPTVFPIVLAHGFNAGRGGFWGFYHVREALEADGHVVYLAEVPPFASTADRAVSLGRQIDWLLGQTGARRVNIVAHSMGGLDSRYLVTTLGYHDRVASITTISTPHRGSPVADTVLAALPRLFDPIVDYLATLWGRTYNDVRRGADVRQALLALATETVRRFNLATPDHAQVFYQSWAGVSSVGGLHNASDRVACEGVLLGDGRVADRMNPLLVPGAAVIAGGVKLIPNDGMVAVASAKWGWFRGCIPADHLDEVGQIENDEPDADTGFDHIRFYRNLAFELAEFGY